MGANLTDLFVAAILAGFEVLTTEEPGTYQVRNREGRQVALIHADFTWFTPTR